MPQFENRCFDYCEGADTSEVPKTTPAHAREKTPPRLKITLPDVTGNESWRRALDQWQSVKITAADLHAVTPSKAPGVRFDAQKEKFTGRNDDGPYMEARITRLRFEIKRCSGAAMKPFERTPPKCSPGYGRKALSYTDDSLRMWSYAHELSHHLSALLTTLPDRQLAARIRAENFSQ